MTSTEPLDPAIRQVLVNLIKGPSIDGGRQSHLWGTLVRNLDVVKARLEELFLDLVVDHDQKVAFCRQKEEDDVTHPTLLRRVRLTFIQSALVLYLRGQLAQADTRGERAVVSDLDMKDFLTIYRRSGDQDLSRFAKACQGAVDKLKSYSILRGLDGSVDRFEVNPALKLIFPADQIRALESAYAEQKSVADSSESDEEEDE